MNGFGTIAILTSASFLWVAGPAAAQPRSPDWGVDSLSSYVVTAWDMEALSSSDQWLTGIHAMRYMLNGTLMAAVHVPNGARILTLDLEACDTTDEGGVNFEFWRVSSVSSSLLGSVLTGAAETPGCGRFTADLVSPETVNNDAFVYILIGGNQTDDNGTQIMAVRLYYQLQVSPAPATATFNDVPASDPAFQYIEALAASGITAGCGSGMYCPNAPLTRRQMAVFLAKALGLHFPGAPSP
jgi:S-layer homology domain